MENRIVRKHWNWPTLLGDLEITTGHMGSASLQLNGTTISRHHGPNIAAQAAQQHHTGHQDWDQHHLPTPPLRYWGQVIEVAF